MKTPEFSLKNGTDETISITYTENGEFGMSGCSWSLSEYRAILKNAGYRLLKSEVGYEGTLYLADDNLEKAIILSGQWIAGNLLMPIQNMNEI